MRPRRTSPSKTLTEALLAQCRAEGDWAYRVLVAASVLEQPFDPSRSRSCSASTQPSSPRNSSGCANGASCASTASASVSATTSSARCCSRASRPRGGGSSASGSPTTSTPHARRAELLDRTRRRPMSRGHRHDLPARSSSRRASPRTSWIPEHSRILAANDAGCDAARLHTRGAARDADLPHPPLRAARAERAARARPATRAGLHDQAHLPDEARHVPSDRDLTARARHRRPDPHPRARPGPQRAPPANSRASQPTDSPHSAERGTLRRKLQLDEVREP